jgi:hypothetical protein
MKTSQVYDRYIIKAEKNGTNDNISTDKMRFVETCNEYYLRYFDYIYDSKNEDDFRNIQSLLIPNKKIEKSKKERDFYSFDLPDNYLNLSSVFALGSKGNCKNKQIDLLYEINDIERAYYLSDDFTSPSFEYREAPYMIGADAINVFYTDFSIDSIYLSYYRLPKKLRLQNPDNPESDFDDSFDVDFDENAINKIISASVAGFDLNNNSERAALNNAFAKQDL